MLYPVSLGNIKAWRRDVRTPQRVLCSIGYDLETARLGDLVKTPAAASGSKA